MATAMSTTHYEIRDCAAGPESHVVVASGEIDLHAAPSLREMLNVASERKPRDLVLDMSAATFLDSAAIGDELGWSASWELSDGLAAAWQWYAARSRRR